MSQTKYKNQTFSIPEEIAKDLHCFVKRREMSSFVADAIRKELQAKKQYLRNCYISSKSDLGQIEAMKDWDCTLMDGLYDW